MDPNAPTPELSPAAPEAAPQAPEAQPTVEPTQEPSTEVTEDQDEKEWDDILNETYGPDKEEDPNEPAKPTEEPKKEETPGKEQEETDEQRAERERQEADEAAKREAEAVQDPGAAAREARAAARESAQIVETLKNDIREKLYANIPTRLQDAEGDPINSPEDVMQLINPVTNKPFTTEEAGVWFLNAQRQFNENYQAMEKEIEQIAELNLDIKDWADSINYKYGEILKKDTKLRDELWADYVDTLEVKDGVIVGAPVNMERFYERALRPYAVSAQADKDKAEADARAAAEAEEKAKKEAEQQRKTARQDRSDIYGGEKDTSVMDDDDKEWSEAAEAYYGRKV